MSPSFNKTLYPNWLYHSLFALLCIVVTAFQWKALWLPYYWDELGVYAPAANALYEHGLSLMPGALDPEFSRGHPLLFAFLGGTAFKLFGSNVFTAHVFAFSVSLLLLLAVYCKAGKYYGYFNALVTVTLIAVQPFFLGLSTLLLPEILLALFAWLALTAFYENKYALAGLYSTLAIFTKESGILLPFTFAAFIIFQQLFYRKESKSQLKPSLLFLLAPFLFFGLFLLVQKAQNGWYFFPYHVSTVSLEVATVKEHFKNFFNFLIWNQNRYWWKWILIGGLIGCIVKGTFTKNSFRNSFPVLLGIFIVGNLCASSLAFYMARYVFLLLPPLALLVSLSLSSITQSIAFRSIVTGVLIWAAISTMDTNVFHYEEDIAYRKSIYNLVDALSYMREIQQPQDSVGGTFPAFYALTTPNNGYPGLKYSQPILNGKHGNSYIIESDPGGWIENKKNLEVVKEFRNGYARTTIYKAVYLNTTSK
ncbi:MAG: glycosyltransferase family 39 protein [Chitinophagales bacterium]